MGATPWIRSFACIKVFRHLLHQSVFNALPQSGFALHCKWLQPVSWWHVMNSSSFLSSKEYIVLFYLKHVWTFWTSHMLLRSTLVELGCFGDPTLDMKTLLVEAWEDYHAWCKENKVHPGQGRFTPGLVSWQLMIGIFSKMDRFRFCMTFIEQKLNVEICMAFVVRFQSENLFSEHMHNVQHFCDEIVCFEAKVFKRHHGAYMTAKAWNGRILCHWLSDCTDAVYAGVYPPAGSQRLLGRWLQANGHVVQDERLLHQKLAMNSDCFKKNVFFPIRVIFSSLGFPMVCRFEQRLQSNFNIFCKSNLALQHPPTLFTTM